MKGTGVKIQSGLTRFRLGISGLDTSINVYEGDELLTTMFYTSRRPERLKMSPGIHALRFKLFVGMSAKWETVAEVHVSDRGWLRLRCKTRKGLCISKRHPEFDIVVKA